MAACRYEVHHCVPRCLLGSFDLASLDELDGAGLQAWSDWGEEAFRHGVDPDVSHGELVALIESSAVEIPEEQHKASHSVAGDFARWAGSAVSKPCGATADHGSPSSGKGAGDASAQGRSTATGHSSRQRRGRLDSRPIFLLI